VANMKHTEARSLHVSLREASLSDGFCLFVRYGHSDHGRAAIAQARKETRRWQSLKQVF
jgi:hypothetical protein